MCEALPNPLDIKLGLSLELATENEIPMKIKNKLRKELLLMMTTTAKE